jgi:hypothetical protein
VAEGLGGSGLPHRHRQLPPHSRCAAARLTLLRVLPSVQNAACVCARARLRDHRAERSGAASDLAAPTSWPANASLVASSFSKSTGTCGQTRQALSRARSGRASASGPALRCALPHLLDLGPHSVADAIERRRARLCRTARTSVAGRRSASAQGRTASDEHRDARACLALRQFANHETPGGTGAARCEAGAIVSCCQRIGAPTAPMTAL